MVFEFLGNANVSSYGFLTMIMASSMLYLIFGTVTTIFGSSIKTSKTFTIGLLMLAFGLILLVFFMHYRVGEQGFIDFLDMNPYTEVAYNIDDEMYYWSYFLFASPAIIAFLAIYYGIKEDELRGRIKH